MHKSELLMSSDPRGARLLLLRMGDQVLKGLLPTPASPLAAPRLCESLGVWLGERLSVVLSAAEWDGLSAFGLDDGFGAGLVTENYVPSPLTGPPAPPVGVGRRAARPLRLASAPRSRTGPGRSVRRRGRQGQEPRHPGCTVLVTSAGTRLHSQLMRKYFE